MKTNHLYLTGCLKNVDAPYCPRNEYEVKRFIEKIESFTEGKIMLIVLWSTRNIKSLFPLKNKVAHRSCIIYERKCSCKLSTSEKQKEAVKFVRRNTKILLENQNPQST